MPKLLLFEVFFVLIRLGCTEGDLINTSETFNTPGALYEGSYLQNSTGYKTAAYAVQRAQNQDGLKIHTEVEEIEKHFIPVLDEDCLQMLQEYASVSSRVVYCALAFSKPVLFCETCVDVFIEAEQKFKEIERMSTCDEPLLRSDRVQILRETHEFLRELWDKGSCKNCFKNISSCEKKKPPSGCQVRDGVVEFQKHINDTLACFDKASASGENVCINCSVVYRNLCKFFSSMGGVEDICIDCVEQMNSTRKVWSTIYNCTNADRDIVSVVSISVFFCSLPIFFYIGSKVHTTKTELKLMKLNRMNKPHDTRQSLPTLPEHGEDFLTDYRT
ncbi:osteopetrosis-associated transmembrane protein 1-like [Asterias rubens]|uniref:osteopetrosis-associated transmembrane protein 1-like n=1 Tax=Asterias rubens TaxID=7604 RepID=UPI00145505E9|nr:osteopetrosis-associated transmembrane protein 1-like [Asterias rubens]